MLVSIQQLRTIYSELNEEFKHFIPFQDCLGCVLRGDLQDAKNGLDACYRGIPNQTDRQRLAYQKVCTILFSNEHDLSDSERRLQRSHHIIGNAFNILQKCSKDELHEIRLHIDHMLCDED
jgi:hypothetical protein